MLDAATSAEVNGVAHCDRLTSRLVRPTPVEIETGSQTASRYKYLSMRRPSLCIPIARVRTESDSLVSSCHKAPVFPTFATRHGLTLASKAANASLASAHFWTHLQVPACVV